MALPAPPPNWWGGGFPQLYSSPPTPATGCSRRVGGASKVGGESFPFGGWVSSSRIQRSRWRARWLRRVLLMDCMAWHRRYQSLQALHARAMRRAARCRRAIR